MKSTCNGTSSPPSSTRCPSGCCSASAGLASMERIAHTLHDNVTQTLEGVVSHREGRQLRHVCDSRPHTSLTRHCQHDITAEHTRAQQHRRQRIAVCFSSSPPTPTRQLQRLHLAEQTVREGQTRPRLVCISLPIAAPTLQHQRLRRRVRRVHLAHVRQQRRVYASRVLRSRTVQHEPAVLQLRTVHLQRRQLRQVYAHTPPPRSLRSVRLPHFGSAPSRTTSRSRPGRSAPHAPISHSPASSSSVIHSPVCSSTTSSASFGTPVPHTTISRSLSIVSVFSVAADAPPMRTDRSSLKPVSHTPPTPQLLKVTAV